MLIASGATAYTFQDAVEHLLDLHEIERDGLNTRRARSSVLHAYRELHARHPWNYYYRTRILSTVAPQTTGTIAFDYTGGAAERLVTLTGATWPDWAAFGRLIINDVHYEVATRESSTTLTLESDSNPGADVAAGTTYTLYRSAYPLPANFDSLAYLHDIDQKRIVPLVTPPAYSATYSTYYDTPGLPWEAAIRPTGEYLGGQALHFGPPPDAARSYELLYRVKPRALAIDQYFDGTVSIASGDATVTGSGTIFPHNCEGSVIRISASGVTAKPTGIVGTSEGIENPFVFQGVIKTRTSNTAVELTENADQTISGSGYVISDPLDIDPTMLTALLRVAEAEFCLRSGRKDATLRQALGRQAVLEAMENDKKRDNTQKRTFFDPYSRTSLTSE